MTQNFLYYPAIVYFLMKGSVLLSIAYAAIVVRWYEAKNPRVLESAPVEIKESLLDDGWYDLLLESGSGSRPSDASTI